MPETITACTSGPNSIVIDIPVMYRKDYPPVESSVHTSDGASGAVVMTPYLLSSEPIED